MNNYGLEIEFTINGVVTPCDDWEAEVTGERDAVSLWYLSQGEWFNIVVKSLSFSIEGGKGVFAVQTKEANRE